HHHSGKDPHDPRSAGGWYITVRHADFRPVALRSLSAGARNLRSSARECDQSRRLQAEGTRNRFNGGCCARADGSGGGRGGTVFKGGRFFLLCGERISPFIRIFCPFFGPPRLPLMVSQLGEDFS